MFIYSGSGGPRSNNPLGNIGCLIFGILGLVALFYILKGLFIALWWASPVLFALSLIINWKVAANTGNSMIQLLKRNPLGGIVTIALAVVGFPFLALYLFLGALGNRQFEKMRKQFEGPAAETMPEDEFVEYEELESIPKQENKEATEIPPPFTEDRGSK